MEPINEGIKPKRCLVICAPSPDQLTTISVSTAKIINAMLSDGWQVDVVSCAVHKARVDETFVRLLKGARLFKVKCPLNKPSLWVLAAFGKVNKVVRSKNYDLLFSISPYSWANVIGFIFKKIYKLPWVVFFGDPWGNNPDLKFPAIRKIMERHVLLSCDTICYSNSKLKDWALSQFPKERNILDKKTFIIPYFYDAGLYPNSIKPKSDHKIILRYLGQIPPGGYIFHLLKAISIMFRENPSLLERFVLELTGRADPRYKGQVVRLIAELDLSDKVIFDYDDSRVIHIPYSASLGLMKSADALLLLGVHPNYFHGWGNVILHVKLIDYLGAQKPIFALAGEGSVTSELLNDGISVCTSDDPHTIKEALVAFVAKMTNPSSLIREQFSKNAVYPQWKRAFQMAMGDGGNDGKR